MALFFVSCGESEESNPLPTPTPTGGDGGPYDPGTTPGTDPRIPDLSRSVAILLRDSTNYSDLAALAGNVFPPLVGDARVAQTISGGRSTVVTGGILVAFEDSEGFWGAQIPSFETAGIRTSTFIDMIFADNDQVLSNGTVIHGIIIRSVGLLSGDTISGALYYRMRQTGEENMCTPATTYCYPVGPLPPNFPWGWGGCNPATIDVVTPCRNYMSGTGVTLLGTFSAAYSNWVMR